VVKRAYLDHALRFHPDRQTDTSADARQRAEFRMREINDAWAVLRNPASRARYDDELAALAEVGTASVPGYGPSSRRSAADRPGASASGVTATDTRLGQLLREPEVADLQRADARPVAPRSGGRWRTWVPAIIGGLVLLTVIVVAAYAQDDEPDLELQTVEQFGVGTCVIVGFGPAAADPNASQVREMVVPVACSEQGAREIVARLPFPKPCPSGSYPQVLPEAKESLCLR
jgi:hypothetical protein